MSAQGIRILVVEDQRLVAADLEDTLKRLGYQVAGSVASAEAAVAKALEVLPDLALMDIRLSGDVDGIQAATEIRARLDIPVIYLTAYADEDTVSRAMRTSPFGYLIKPFNERELRAAIEIAIYKHTNDLLLAEERARRQAAEEFKFLVEGVQDYAIFLLDVAGRVTTWNVGAQRIKGYESSEVVGRHFRIFFTPEDVERRSPEEQLRLAVERGRSVGETWRVRKDGSRFWAHTTIDALRDDAGNVRGFAKVTRDMTEARTREIALRETVARVRAMTEGALDAIISLDAAGRVTDWNPAAERTFGYARDEAMGRELAELLVPARLRSAHREALVRCLATGEGPILGQRIELPAMTKSAGEIDVELTVMRILVGETPAFTGFLRDITAQKEAERERRKHDASRALLDRLTVALSGSLTLEETIGQALRHAVPDLADACLVDLEVGKELVQSTVVHVDPEREALARRRHRVESAPGAEGGPAMAFATARPQVHPPLDLVGWDGAVVQAPHPELFVELGARAYLCVAIGAGETPTGVLSLLRCASARRFDADDLELAQEVARRIGLAVQNARLFREAQAAVRARDEFLQVASHELRTPLAPLQLQLDSAVRLLAKSGPGNDRLVAKLEVSLRQTERLARLVESLLDVSRITSGRLELDFETCDLSGLVVDLAERFMPEAIRAGSELRISSCGEVLGVWDRLRVEQIISNLVSNAVKYGAGRPIAIAVTADEGVARVAVSDAGIGIDESAQGLIFGRFERGVSLRHYGGLGLGLYIAREYAEAHGGTIAVRSKPSVGSTFTIELPRDARAAAQRREAEERVLPA